MVTLPALPPRLTHVEARACLAACEAALRGAPAGTGAVLDASALQAFDSSAVAVLLALRRAALARSVTLKLQGLSPRLCELATLYGVGELLPG